MNPLEAAKSDDRNHNQADSGGDTIRFQNMGLR